MEDVLIEHLVCIYQGARDMAAQRTALSLAQT